MVKHCILIFPEFRNIDLIEDIRRRYDPAFRSVPPHVTLVFPFTSDMPTDTLRRHIEVALLGVEPVPLCLSGVSVRKDFGNYLLLDVHRGRNKLIEVHRRLYTGLLAPYLPQWRRSFDPHLTIGKIEDDAAFERAWQEVRGLQAEFRTCVREIAVEIIGPHNESTIEMTFQLPVES